MIILKIAGLYLFQRMPEDPNTPTPTESEAWWDEIMEGLEPQPKGPQLSKLIPEEQLEQVLNQQRQEMSLQQIQEQGKQYFGQWDKELPELDILDSDLSEPDQANRVTRRKHILNLNQSRKRQLLNSTCRLSSFPLKSSLSFTKYPVSGHQSWFSSGTIRCHLKRNKGRFISHLQGPML